MKYRGRYSIGDMSRICNISKKTLRYYDDIGLIASQRQDYNNYRYYTGESLLNIPIIKYYKQMGFTLDEMRSFIEGDVPNVYRAIKTSFRAKVKELELKRELLRRNCQSVNDWHDLIHEAEIVIDHNVQEPAIRYVEESELIFQEQIFDGDLKASITNIDFTNFLEEIGNEITGPVILNFSSLCDRVHNRQQTIRIMQKPLMPCPDENKIIFGGHMMATCYHIGPHETLGETYKKICTWVNSRPYTLSDFSYERYVTDYWTTKNSSLFVTEVMIKVSRKTDSIL